MVQRDRKWKENPPNLEVGNHINLLPIKLAVLQAKNQAIQPVLNLVLQTVNQAIHPLVKLVLQTKKQIFYPVISLVLQVTNPAMLL